LANGINNAGQIAGAYYDSNGNGHGFLYTNGVFKTIDDPNGVETFANGINNAGQIVGTYTDSSGSNHSFLYANGVFKTIDDPNGDPGTSAAFGINDIGQFVGSFLDTTGKHGYVAGAASVPNPPTLLSPQVAP
jgi:probable HAF family extracellular repeat protein